MFKDYNINQVILPLDLEIKLKENDIAYAVHALVEQIPDEALDVEPVFGFLKANLHFTRMSVRGKKKVENELGFAFMAVNLRKYTAKHANSATNPENNLTKKGSDHLSMMIGTFFRYFGWLCPSLFCFNY